MFIVAIVIAVVQIVAMAIVGGGMAGFGDNLGMAIIILLCSVPLLPFAYVGLFLNWKKILIGIIAPIPLLSYFKQFLINGMICAVKAFIVIVKKKDRLVVCDGKAEIDGAVEYEEEEEENV